MDLSKECIFIILVYHSIASQALKLAKAFCVAPVGFLSDVHGFKDGRCWFSLSR